MSCCSGVKLHVILQEDGTWTTPYKIEYKQKPDWQNLIPLFSLGYVKQNRDSTQFRSTADSQTVKAICVGSNTKSDGLLFYLPHLKKLIASSDYKLNPMVPSGPIFGLTYDGCIGFDLLSLLSEQFRPPAYEVRETIYFKCDDKEGYSRGFMLISPSREHPLATVQDYISGDVLQ
eukprot:3051463-Ditylum_brightwellii.AAC.1